MFFLIGRRYPWLTLIIGVALLVIAAVTGSVVFALIGAVGVLLRETAGRPVKTIKHVAKFNG